LRPQNVILIMKRYLFELIDEAGNETHPWNKAFDLLIIGLILASIVSIILESFEALAEQHGVFFQWFELVTVIIFSIEYVLRLWTANLKYPELSPLRARLKFAFSPMGMIDFLAILPFYLPILVHMDFRFVRILRVLRMLRIFKINRYTKSLQLVGRVFYERRNELGVTIFVTLILMFISATLMYYIEHDDQPKAFPDIISTLWWAVATLTTVGYGDVYPVTGMGKLISGIIALLGIGLVALPTGILGAGFIEQLEKNEPSKPEQDEQSLSIQQPYRFCPHCGKQLPH
jgi:voltage-gated potassium channel